LTHTTQLRRPIKNRWPFDDNRCTAASWTRRTANGRWYGTKAACALQNQLVLYKI